MNAALTLPALLASLLLGGPFAQAAETGLSYKVRAVYDVSYYDGKASDAFRHKLDLFVPEDKKDFPVVVFLHGGCWTIGDKSCVGLYSAIGKFLARNGIGAVLPNYRLSPWVKHPEHIKDVARAYAWTHANIGKYGGDPAKMFIAGHSAGGHLAALLATDEQYLKAEGLSRKDIRGVIGLSGVYRIPDSVEAKLMVDGATLGRLALHINPFDLAFPTTSEGRKEASPICHVCAGLPPFLLIYAENDLPLLPEMAEKFALALKEKKCDVELVKAAGRRHNDIAFRAISADDPAARAMLDFIAKHEGK